MRRESHSFSWMENHFCFIYMANDRKYLVIRKEKNGQEEESLKLFSLAEFVFSHKFNPQMTGGETLNCR